MARLVSAAVVAVLVLAGCIGSEPQASEAEPMPEAVPTGTGFVRGVVVDNTITPIPNATVRLQGLDRETTTDAGGEFQFLELGPGVVTMEVSKPGWISAQSSAKVLIDDPEPPAVRIILAAVASHEPRALTLQDSGLIACMWGTPVVYDSCADELGQTDDTRLQYGIEGLPSAIQVEVVWESSQPLADNLYMINAVCPPADYERCPGGTPKPSTAPYRWGEGSYTSPAIMRTPPGFIQEALDYHYLPAMKDWSVGVDVTADGPALATGITIDQEFHGYVTIFWNIEPDPAWTFVEDGTYRLPG